MFAFLTGICLGLAVGWISYLKHASLVTLFFLYVGPAIYIIRLVVVLPLATASGAMDMGFMEFSAYALDFYFGDFWSVALSWFIFGSVFSRIVAEVGYKAYVPDTPRPETRDDRRRRVRAAMRYSDDYFD